MTYPTFCFLDAETTGLEPGHDQICEIAWAFTDDDFNVIGTPQTFVTEITGSGWTRLRDNAFVLDMHTRSGLLTEMKRDDVMPIDSALDKLWVQLQEVTQDHEHLISPAGLSVHFDKAMIVQAGWGSLFADWRTDEYALHHRMYDLSSVKIALRNAGAPFDTPENKGAHRALNDVFETIEQARIFRTRLEGLGL